MALSGDIQQFPGVQFGATVFVNALGEVSAQPTDCRVCGILRVIDGSYEDILHLIGHSRNQIEYLFVNDVLRATDEVKTRLKQLPQRLPNSFLIEDNGRLYGVVIDGSGQTRVVGVVTRVVPGRHLDINFISVLIDKDDNWMFCSLKDLDIKAKILLGTLFGIISRDGFLFLQIKTAVEELSELVLVLNGGYYLIENAKIDWIRPKSKEDNEIISSTIETNECMISSRGSCVRTDIGFEIFGIENSIISFRKLQEMIIKRRQSHPELDSNEYLAQNFTISEWSGSHSSPKPIEHYREKD